MFDDVAVSYGSRFFLAAGGVALALICLFAILWFIRSRAPSPFVRGGRNRQPRLQVLDAAAVDARRRLVLVRRDGVEHLIMIGGPTDIVIESGIDPNRVNSPVASFEALSASEPLSFSRPDPQPEPERAVPVQPRQAPTQSVQPVEMQPQTPPAARELQPLPQRQPEPVAEPEPDADLYTPAVATLETPPQRSEPVLDLDARRRMQQQNERPRAVAEFLQPQPSSPVPSERIEEVHAADILDAARSRVLTSQPERPAPAPVATPPAQSLPVVDHGMPVTPRDSNIRPAPSVETVGPAVDLQPPVREHISEFQAVLDEEMANDLTAERIVPNAQVQPARPVQSVQSARRDPELPPITGADSALQREVARIFGEMSVNRDK
jgi:hypothetical protein